MLKEEEEKTMNMAKSEKMQRLSCSSHVSGHGNSTTIFFKKKKDECDNIYTDGEPCSSPWKYNNNREKYGEK